MVAWDIAHRVLREILALATCFHGNPQRTSQLILKSSKTKIQKPRKSTPEFTPENDLKK